MKKITLYLITFLLFSCSLDDEKLPAEEVFSIDFTLNGIDYSVTNYTVKIDPTNEWNRIVTLSFDNDTKLFSFHVEVEETNEIGQIILQDADAIWISNQGIGDRETSIVIHTNANMQGTFRVTIEDNLGNAKYKFTNGEINIQY
jgi:hypothetical protein